MNKFKVAASAVAAALSPGTLRLLPLCEGVFCETIFAVLPRGLLADSLSELVAIKGLDTALFLAPTLGEDLVELLELCELLRSLDLLAEILDFLVGELSRTLAWPCCELDSSPWTFGQRDSLHTRDNWLPVSLAFSWLLLLPDAIFTLGDDKSLLPLLSDNCSFFCNHLADLSDG